MDKVIARKDGFVGRLLFNNPERHNAMSLAMWQATATILDDFIADETIRVIVLSGAGGKAFAAGADISRFEEERATREAIIAYDVEVAAVCERLAAAPKPTLALIQGYCIGGGLAIAVSCDLRICTDEASFALPAARLGVGYAPSGIRQLAALVGSAYAKEICFTARRFTAAEAQMMGLVNRVLPATDIEEYVADYAAAIADNAPLTLAAMKAAFVELAKDPAERDVTRCQALVERCFDSDDYTEGRRAFMEKRRPQFQGR